MSQILVVESVHHEDIARMMRDEVIRLLEERGIGHKLVTVPGALELASAANIVLATTTTPYDGIIALGCVLKGETIHYDIVAEQAVYRLQKTAIDRFMPLGIGIIMAGNMDQARARVQKYARGAFDACMALIAINKSGA